MHANSLRAYASEGIKLSRRASEVLGTIMQMGSTTDRMIKDRLGYRDMNSVRPRISELIKNGLVEECGNMRDNVTGKTVRIVRIKPARDFKAPLEQGELFPVEQQPVRSWGF